MWLTGRTVTGDFSILSLDQEKAYDRVEWSNLTKILETFGFGARIRNWIHCCYSSLTAKLAINGSKSEPYLSNEDCLRGTHLHPSYSILFLSPFCCTTIDMQQGYGLRTETSPRRSK